MRDRESPRLPKLFVVGTLDGVLERGDHVACDVTTAEWPSVAKGVSNTCGADVLVAVVAAFTRETTSFFESLSRKRPGIPLLAVLPAAAFDSVHFRDAVATADDFLLMPARVEEWHERVTRLAGRHEADSEGDRELESELASVMGLLQLVGTAPSFLEVVRKVPLIARSGSPALITGETGTGKELCARAIHFSSPRRNQPFIPVDCGAIPDNLFENELFGHVRGAFTDAHRDQRGLVALAEGGTLFLDEVDSLSTLAQSKLLRFLQDRSYRPLGSDRFLRANVNVLAATNRHPETLVKDKQFRADLFFRLNVVRLHLSPLRERLSDVPLLARHFVTGFAAESGLGARTLSPAVIAKLLAHDWPGNVRELSNVLQRAVVLASDRQILPGHVTLPDMAADVETSGQDAGVEIDAGDGSVSFRQGRARVLEAFERTYVSRLIEKHGGNVTRAAREAQKDRRAFGRLLKKHGLRSGSPH